MKSFRRLMSTCSIFVIFFSVFLTPFSTNAEEDEVLTKEFTLPESQNQLQQHSITIDDLGEIKDIIVDDGDVTYSTNGRKIDVNLNNSTVDRTEYNPKKHSKSASNYQTSSLQNGFSNSMPYNDGSFTGILYQTGSPYVISGMYIPSDTIWVTDQTSPYYNVDGYSGTLEKYVYSGDYIPEESKTVTDSRTSSTNNFPASIPYNSGGYSGTLSKSGSVISRVISGSYIPGQSKTVETVRTSSYNDFPSSIPYNSGGYSGVLYPTYLDEESFLSYILCTDGTRVSREDTCWLGGSSPKEYVYSTSYTQHYSGTVTTSAIDTRVFEYTQNYSGSVTKPALDTRVYRYQGYVTKPAEDTRLWKQEYSGTVYQGGDDFYYQYKVTVKYLKDKTPPILNLVYHDKKFSHKVVVNIESSDTESGVKQILLPDGSIIPRDSGIFTINKNGEYTFGAEDWAGNVTTKTIDIHNIDNDIPNTPTIEVKENGDNHHATVTIKDNGDNGVAGVDRIEYSLTGATTKDWTTYDKPFILSNNGYTTVTARVIDNIDNVSSTSTKTVLVDKEAPSMVIEKDISDFTNTDIILTVTATDTLSGIKRIKLPDGNYVNDTTATFIVTKNGTYEFEAEDNFGNIGTQSITINNKDTSAPTFKNYYVENLTKEGYDVVVEVEDDISGINRVQFPTWTVLNGQDDLASSWSVNPSVRGIDEGNGKWRFHVDRKEHNNEFGDYITEIYVYDNAGNQANAKVTAYLDNDYPNLYITPSETNWTKNDIILSVQATDVGSGVSKIKLPNGNWIKGDIISYTVSQNGTYTFVAEDAVGNQTSKSIIISNIDKTPPTSPTLSNNQEWTKQSFVQVTTKNGTDGQSGFSHVEYKLEGATVQGWIKSNGSFQINNEGITKITARSLDKVGNSSSEVVSFVKIDRSAPHNISILIKLKP